MSLLIKQGKQDTSKDVAFEIIIEKNVTLKVSKITLSTARSGALNVELTVLNGPNKGRKVFDLVDYSETSGPDGQGKLAWKYRALRKAAGCPYDPSEPVSIDIEKLLLNKAVVADLEINKYKNKKGEDVEGQGIKYSATKTPTTAPQTTGVATPLTQAEADELPFNDGSSEENSSEDDPLKGW